MAEKYAHLNFTPPASAGAAAKRGLELRAGVSPSNRGMTAVGIARARQLINRQKLNPATVRRMVSFFARHEVDKQGKGWSAGSEGYPSKGLQAWLGWGGDPGRAWANKVARQMEAADKK